MFTIEETGLGSGVYQPISYRPAPARYAPTPPRAPAQNAALMAAQTISANVRAWQAEVRAHFNAGELSTTEWHAIESIGLDFITQGASRGYRPPNFDWAPYVRRLARAQADQRSRRTVARSLILDEVIRPALSDVMPNGTANPAAATPGANAPVELWSNPLVTVGNKINWTHWAFIGGCVAAALALGYLAGQHRT